MPTGYTAKLMESGQSFNDFVLTCARAMGALVMMRDDPMEAPIPEFQPSDHYAESIEKFQSTLTSLQSMSESESLAYGEQAKAEKLKMLLEWLTKEQTENLRLKTMEREVLAWIPPTKEHVGLKDFMLDQIRISSNDSAYIKRQIEEVKCKSAHGFWVEAVRSASHSLDYYTTEQAKEIERVRSRNVWVKQLRESLTSTSVAVG